MFLSFSLQFNFLAQVEGSLRAQNSYGNKKSVFEMWIHWEERGEPCWASNLGTWASLAQGQGVSYFHVSINGLSKPSVAVQHLRMCLAPVPSLHSQLFFILSPALLGKRLDLPPCCCPHWCWSLTSSSRARSIYHENTRLHFIPYIYVSKLVPSGSCLWLMSEREMMHPWSHLCLRGWGRGHTEGGSVGLAAAPSHLLAEQEKQGELCRAAHCNISLWLRAMPWAKHGSF